MQPAFADETIRVITTSTVEPSMTVIEPPAVIERYVEAPVVTERVIEKPVVTEKVIEKPVVVRKTVESPVVIEDNLCCSRDHLLNLGMFHLFNLGLF
jgi:hypothetical protein